MSADLIWQLVGKNNAFRRTSNGITFTGEPGNMTNLPTYRHSGFARKGLSISEKNHVVSLTISNPKTKKATRTAKVMNLRKGAGFKHNSKALYNIIIKNKFRPDLCKLAMRRLAILTKATRIAKSINPPKPKKVAKKAAAPAATESK